MSTRSISYGCPLSSCFTYQQPKWTAERPDSTWARVKVVKRAENTTSYNLKTYVLNTKTGDLYFDDPVLVVAVKCGLVVIVAPLFTAMQMTWHASKLVIAVADYARKLFQEVLAPLFQKQRTQAKTAFYAASAVCLNEVGHELWKIASSPMYCIAAQLAACTFPFSPYNARAYVAAIERKWHDEVSISSILRDCENLDRTGGCQWIEQMRAIKDIYMAYCFQKRGNLDHDARGKYLNPHYREMEIIR